MPAPGVYIHVPFCARVCPYCDFAVQTGGAAKRARFTAALVDEIGRVGDEGGWQETAPFDTVYLGGGTPSSLAPDAIDEILTAARRRLDVAPDADVTLEANPEDVSAVNIAAWESLGITRLSLGVQSFDVAALDLLGRVHTGDDAIAATESALAASFDVVSIDLIFGVPDQSRESWETTLRRAIGLMPHHVSCYELTVHEATPFFRARQRGELVELVDDAKASLFFATHRILADGGFEAYEVSNFARRPACHSRHNRKYWDHTPYLGVGPSAHSFDGKATRWSNESRFDDWAAAIETGRSPRAEREVLSGRQLALEALALGFRTCDGVDLEAIERRFGVRLVGFLEALIEQLEARSLVVAGDAPRRLVPTLRGMAIADTLATSFRIYAGETTAP